jgi:hypothetical protein
MNWSIFNCFLAGELTELEDFLLEPFFLGDATAFGLGAVNSES